MTMLISKQGFQDLKRTYRPEKNILFIAHAADKTIWCLFLFLMTKKYEYKLALCLL